MTRLALKTRLAAAAAMALALAACKDDHAPTASPTFAPLAVLDSQADLPPAPPAPIARHAPEQGYRWAERAYGVQRAVYDAPPDYGFAYGDEEPMAWETADDWSMYAEPWEDGYRYYYYQPGADYPYFVRDDDYGYGYDRGGTLVAVVDAGGRYLPAQEFRRVAPIAGRYYARGRDLRSAGLHARRVAVDERDWATRAPRVTRGADRWLQAAHEDRAWRQWREADRNRELDRFTTEQVRRAELQRTRAADLARRDVRDMGRRDDQSRRDFAEARQRQDLAARAAEQQRREALAQNDRVRETRQLQAQAREREQDLAQQRQREAHLNQQQAQQREAHARQQQVQAQGREQHLAQQAQQRDAHARQQQEQAQAREQHLAQQAQQREAHARQLQAQGQVREQHLAQQAQQREAHARQQQAQQVQQREAHAQQAQREQMQARQQEQQAQREQARQAQQQARSADQQARQAAAHERAAERPAQAARPEHGAGQDRPPGQGKEKGKDRQD